MALRDLPYRPYRSVLVFTGLDAEVIRRVPEALHEFLHEKAAAPIRGRLRPHQFAGSVQSAHHLLPAGLHERDVIATAARLPFADLPLNVAISGDVVAICISHRVVDGVGALEVVQYVVSRAAGETSTTDDRPPLTFPLLRALRRAGRAGVAHYRQLTLDVIEGPPVPKPTAEDLALRNASFVSFVMDDELVRLIAAYREKGPFGRASSNTRIMSLLIAALRAVYRGSGDMRIDVPLDMRSLVGGARVTGNYIAVDPFGTLLTGDWSPSRVSAAIAARLSSGAPAVGSVMTLLRYLLRTVRDRLRQRRTFHPAYTVSLSMLGSRKDFPAAAWRPDKERRFGIATIGPWPSATFASVATLGRVIRVSAWDESQLFDLTRFEEEIRREAADRAR